MKFFRFLISFTITIILTILLSLKIAQVPPLGEFLDPFHGFWQNAEGEKYFKDIPANLSLSGLTDEVQVKYDENLIPHIFAENETDLYFTQGYIAARDRLWQMEFQTHAAAGRLSEIVGKAAIHFDRLQRRKGLMFAANNALTVIMENDTLANAVEAYAKGVNTYIASLEPKDLPVEYKLLDYAPEPWTTLKSALLLKYMADDLTGWDADFENTNAIEAFGEDNFNFLFPDHLSDTATVYPEGTSYDFEPIDVIKPDSLYFNTSSSIGVPNANPDNGSNNWVVSGSKTNSSNPILANDPHLGLNLPSIWYAMQLHTPDMNVMGATLLGAPGIIIGFNESVAWGVTNAGWDVRDWYYIQFKDSDRTEYLFDDKWLKTQKTIEEIKVRGGNTFYDTVIYTHYGPVTYDAWFSGTDARKNFAMRWTAHDPSLELMTFYKLNRAENYEDFTAALQYWSNPGQNFAFASVQGNIAIRTPGKFPLKWEGQGKFVLDGRKLNQEWQTFIPYAHTPSAINPKRGFLSSANQFPVQENYPYYIYGSKFEDYRNRRINHRLEEMSNITPQDMMKLQNDNYNLQAAESLPMMLNSLILSSMNNEQKEAYTLMRGWDFYNEAGSKAASFYEIWWLSLKKMVWDEFRASNLVLNYPDDYNSIHILKNFPENEFIDIKATPEKETSAHLIRSSFEQAIDSLSNWTASNEKDYRWADFKATKLQHLLRLDAFSIENVQIGGNKNIVNATSSRHGPSWRMVVELGDEIEAWGIYPGGQSGNPGSIYYNNMVEKWKNGEYIQLLFLKNSGETNDRIIFKQNLAP